MAQFFTRRTNTIFVADKLVFSREYIQQSIKKSRTLIEDVSSKPESLLCKRWIFTRDIQWLLFSCVEFLSRVTWTIWINICVHLIIWDIHYVNLLWKEKSVIWYEDDMNNTYMFNLDSNKVTDGITLFSFNSE